MRVLLVEDEERIAAFLTKGLRRGNHSVDVVSAGKDALEALLDSDPEHDVLVLDLGLPDMDGLEVLRRVREHGVQMPVIVVTARTDRDDRTRAEQLGVDDYLAKPFPIKELLASIDRHGRQGHDPLLRGSSMGAGRPRAEAP
ncbi:MAG: response regulator transcription factor [Actinomycetota bacterium]|nr:response regulator transcription factor [Actinomycetota bacterium]